jgi:hypothetical protein
MVFRAWPVAALLLLAACAGPAPQPGVTTERTGAMTDLPLAEAERIMVDRLQGLGFSVEDRPETGVVAATIDSGAPAEWAFCDRIQVRDSQDGNRTQWTDVETLRVQINVRLTELGGGTSVTLSPRYTGTYLNRFDNLPFDRLCASAGVLEPMLLAGAS